LKLISNRVCFGVLNIKYDLCDKYGLSSDLFEEVTRITRYSGRGEFFKFKQRLKDFMLELMKETNESRI
jgi:hypothetical protein